MLSFLVSLPPADLKLHSSVRAQKLPQDTFQSNAGCQAGEKYKGTVWTDCLLSPPFVRLQLSNTLYESSGQWWFSVDSVSLLYNTSEEAVFNASEVYAPASSSYHCLHVSNLQRYNALLLPSTEHARRWAITFTDFQVPVSLATSTDSGFKDL